MIKNPPRQSLVRESNVRFSGGAISLGKRSQMTGSAPPGAMDALLTFVPTRGGEGVWGRVGSAFRRIGGLADFSWTSKVKLSDLFLHIFVK